MLCILRRHPRGRRGGSWRGSGWRSGEGAASIDLGGALRIKTPEETTWVFIAVTPCTAIAAIARCRMMRPSGASQSAIIAPILRAPCSRGAPPARANVTTTAGTLRSLATTARARWSLMAPGGYLSRGLRRNLPLCRQARSGSRTSPCRPAATARLHDLRHAVPV